MRNIFESLSQNASADQQHLLMPKKPSKWDKPAAQRSADVMSSDGQNHYVSSGVDGDHELVHGTSTVFVVEDELPPPAFTRNIVAKFRELEESSVDKTVPLPGTLTPSRSSYSYSGSVPSRTYQSSEHSYASTEDDVADGSLFTEPAGRQNGEERGRSEKRSEVRRRQPSSSPEQSIQNDLPQEGTARSLLARWRTIEQRSGRGGDTKRSQSTSRIEVRRLYKADDNNDEEEGVSTRYLASKIIKCFN